METKDRVYLAVTVGVAAIMWFFTFYVEWGNFWVKISVSAALLSALALVKDPSLIKGFRPSHALWGLLSAVVLYLVFMLGDAIAGLIFDFAPDQVGGIYEKGEGTPAWVICLLLFFVTGPSEEIYWRGFLQGRLEKLFGGPTGFVLAAAVYALVHLPSMNFMLVGAAAVAGGFWGLQYLLFRRIYVNIISHSIWSTVIFAVLPVT